MVIIRPIGFVSCCACIYASQGTDTTWMVNKTADHLHMKQIFFHWFVISNKEKKNLTWTKTAWIQYIYNSNQCLKSASNLFFIVHYNLFSKIKPKKNKEKMCDANDENLCIPRSAMYKLVKELGILLVFPFLCVFCSCSADIDWLMMMMMFSSATSTSERWSQGLDSHMLQWIHTFAGIRG